MFFNAIVLIIFICILVLSYYTFFIIPTNIEIYLTEGLTGDTFLSGGSKEAIQERHPFRQISIAKVNEPNPLSEASDEKYIAKDLLKTIQSFERFYDRYPKIFGTKKFLKFYHPFVDLQMSLKTQSMPRPATITNAFKKLLEILIYLYPSQQDITMFDIASAPCMFIICAEKFFNNVEWQINSLEGADKVIALEDVYGVIAHNKQKYHSGDVTKKNERDRIIRDSGKKFELVTGDIGAPLKEYNSNLQEDIYAQMQFGQFVLAMHLCEENGNIVLKMYSLITYNSLFIIDLASIYFERVEIVKPYTSKIFNYECYILGIKRNSRVFIEPEFQNNAAFNSPNKDVVKKFEQERSSEKMWLAKLYVKIHDTKKWEKNKEYKEYFDKCMDAYNELERVMTRKVIQ
jgi:23S rRNA U2552 (ribose-2'-O)-methylase RlmE/FtsJ